MEWNNSLSNTTTGLCIARQNSYEYLLSENKKKGLPVDDLQKKVDNNECYFQYTKFHMLCDFIREYTYAKKLLDDNRNIPNSVRSRYENWSEVLCSKGRIVLDIDIGKEDPLFEQICKRYPLDEKFFPQGFDSYLKDVIVRSFQYLGKEEIASLLCTPSILWFIDPMMIDRNNNIHHLGKGVYASPICISSQCRSDKISFHITLPVYSTQRHTDTKHLNSIMSYTMIQDGFNLRYGEMICDTNMEKERQNLRLPYMRKIGKDGYLQLHDPKHFPFCITSYIDGPYQIPEELHLKSPLESAYSNILFSSLITEVPDQNIDIESLWERMNGYDHCKVICNHYSGINPTNGYKLIPKDSEEWYCPVCDRKHTSNIPGIFNSGKNYYLSCTRMKQYGRKSILIEKNSNNQVKERISDEILQSRIYPLYGVPNDIHKDIYKDIRCKPCPSIDEYNTILICSYMGSGKTYQIRELIKGILDDRPIILVLPRIALCEQWNESLKDSNFTLYNQKDNWYKSHRVISTIESAYKWTFFGKEPIIIFDEIETTIRQLESPTQRSFYSVLSWFKDIIHSKNTIIGMDAYLTWYLTGQIFQIYGRDTRNMIISWNQIQMNEIEHKVVHDYDSKDEWMTKIALEPEDTTIDIRTGIYTAEIASQILQMRNMDLNEVVIINADSNIKNMDVNKSYKKGKIVCVNSTHLVGNSFDDDYFDVQYTYINSCTATGMDAIQMESRVRKHRRNDIHSHIVNSRQEYYNLYPKWYIEHMNKCFNIPEYELVDDEITWRFLLKHEDRIAYSLIHTQNAFIRHYTKEIYRFVHEKIHGYDYEYHTLKTERKEIEARFQKDIIDIVSSIKSIDQKIKTCNNEEEKKILLEKKNTLSCKKDYLREKMKEEINDMVANSEIQKIPKSQTAMEWKDISLVINDTINDIIDPKILLIVTMDIDQIRIERMKNRYRNDHKDIYPMFIMDHHIKLLVQAYYYHRKLKEKNIDFSWKHSEKIFYDIWLKDGRDIVNRCIHTLSLFQEYMNLVESDVKDGIYKDIAMKNNLPKIGWKRDCIVYARLLLYLKSFSIEKTFDNLIILRFPSSLVENRQFKLLLEKFDRYFEIGFIHRGTISKEIWYKLKKLLYKQYCISTTHQQNRDKDGYTYHDYTYTTEDTLI